MPCKIVIIRLAGNHLIVFVTKLGVVCGCYYQV